MTLDELMHSKLYWAQIILVIAALTLSFTTDWFLTLAIYACIGLVVCAVLTCRWMWQDMELGEQQPHHARQPLRLTLRGRRLVLLLVLMLVSVVALTVSVQHHPAEQAQSVEHLYGFMQPVCWHTPMLPDPTIPDC